MKKVISFAVALILLTSLFAVNVSAVKKFSDVPSGCWYEDYVNKLTAKGIIEGYSNGKFGPKDSVTVAQMITMVVRSLGYNNLKYYTGYVDKAKDIGIVDEREFPTKASLERAITRAESARIIIRGIKNETFVDNLDLYIGLVKDYDSITGGMQSYVLKAYSKGILEGYSNGNFGPNDKSTRAQASKMIMNMIDPSLRTPPAKGETIKIKGYDVPVNPIVSIETSSVNNIDIALYISVIQSLEPQYNQVEVILSSKFGSDSIKDIMNYVKLKKDRYTDLPEKSFYIKGQKVIVDSSNLSIQIAVYFKKG